MKILLFLVTREPDKIYVSSYKLNLNMKLLQSSQKHLAMLGISSNQNLTNLKHFIAELNNISHFGSSCAFLLYEVNSFSEYTYATFFAATTGMIAACFSIFAIERHHIFKMIDIGEELIEKSE